MSEDRILHRDWSHPYPIVERAEGMYVYTTDGRRYLDALGGVYVVNIGYGVPEVAAAVQRQMAQTSFAYSGQFTTHAELELAERVLELAPRGMARAFFVSGGSEANEAAAKIARQYHLRRGQTGRWKIIGRWQSYHGATGVTLGMSGHGERRRDYQQFLPPFPHAAAVSAYRCPFPVPPAERGAAYAEELERLIRQEGPETVAAFIAEPVGGASSGAEVPPDDYFRRIREVCDRYDVLLIADEVITGFGRTGRTFGMDHWGVVPDIMTTGKGMSSGYAPLGGIVVHERVVDVLTSSSRTSFFTGYTYTGHPVACAAGSAVLDYLAAHDLIARAARQGERLHRRLVDLRRLPTVGDVRGLGLLAGIELVADKATKAPFPREAAVSNKVARRAHELGVIVAAGHGTVDGVLGDHLLFAPPFIIEDEQIEEIASVLEEAIAAAGSA